MKAYRHLQRIKREQLAMFELPIAQLASLTANINRDSKRSPKPFTLEDFALFYERDKSEGFPVQAALVALSAREQRMLRADWRMASACWKRPRQAQRCRRRGH